ncbi:MAG: response regulator [Verrucomicrobia bacterium]|nr:response regulator [Verrucomicrobiota bacterium]
MNPHLSILNVEDEPQTAELIQRVLSKEWPDCELVRVDTRAEFVAALNQRRFDLIICDYTMPDFDGLSALNLARERAIQLPFLFVSGTLGEDVAVEALQRGATDYVLKTHLPRLVPAVRRALEESRERARRHNAEETLRRREDYFHALMENTSDIVTIVDEAGLIRYASPSVERVLGFRPDDWIGQNLSGRVHPDDVSELFTALSQSSQRAGVRVTLGFRFRHHDGSWRFLEVSAKNLLHHPEVTGIILNARDVTERREAEAKVREQTELLDKAQDAICVADMSCCITFWNKSAARMFGLSAAEVVGQNALDLFGRSVSVSLVEARRTLDQEGEWHCELRYAGKTGRELVIESRWTLVRDQGGKPKAILVINTDITEEKSLEARFLRMQRLENIGALASGVAHDLNNVLAPILMSIELLRRHVEEPDGCKLLDTLESSAQRGTGMVRQILSFARGKEGGKMLVNVRHRLLELRKIVTGTFPPAIELQVRTAGDLWCVQADATQLDQVLLNLCLNARDAMPNGGRLRVGAENLLLADPQARLLAEAKPGPYVVLSVADSGTGIPAEILDRIFDPFFTTKESGKGTGLGLATVQRIVKDHHGFVTVSSEVGRGAEFKVYLPAVPAEETGHPVPSVVPLPSGHGELVLVVDDESSVREITKAILEAYNFRVLLARDGTEALAKYVVHQDEIHVVLTDLQMPYMDGVATVRALRRLNPSVHIIAASGLNSVAELLDAQDLSVQGIVTKPFTAEKLLNQLHAVLYSP